MQSFLDIDIDEWLYSNKLFFIIKDKYPVSPGHLLIVSKRLAINYFDLDEEEKAGLDSAILKAKELIETEIGGYPDGYNIGFNVGRAAGQTVMHFHCHVIPRFIGDMANPDGGIRYCIPDKGKINHE